MAARPTKRRRPAVETLEGRALLASGILDPTFGVGTGYVKTDLGTSSDAAGTVAVQPWDGKIVVAENSYSGSNASSNLNFTLARYNADGSLDTTFGSGGVVRTDFYGGNDVINAIVFTPDHKIDAVGRAYIPSGKSAGMQIGVARYNADGSLDTTFGGGGKVAFAASTALRSSGSSATAAALDPSGRLVMAGSYVVSSRKSAVNNANILARLNPNGSLDASFGSGGVVLGAMGSYSYDTWANLRLVPSGTSYKIDAYGVDQRKDSLAQFNPNGTRDTSFGSGGEVVLGGGGFGGGGGTILMAFEPDGGFVGVNDVNYTTFTLTRYDASGGVVYEANEDFSPLLPPGTTYGSFKISALGVDSSGRVVAAGSEVISGAFPSTRWDSFLARFDGTTGALDGTFGSGGLVLSDFGPFNDEFTSLAIAPDGSIVAAGYDDDGSGSVDANGNWIQQKDLLVARYAG
jgi:uncharacterized delta-60 repeat protein